MMKLHKGTGNAIMHRDSAKVILSPGSRVLSPTWR